MSSLPIEKEGARGALDDDEPVMAEPVEPQPVRLSVAASPNSRLGVVVRPFGEND